MSGLAVHLCSRLMPKAHCLFALLLIVVWTVGESRLRAEDGGGASLRVSGRTADEWNDFIKSLSLTSREATEAVPGLIELVKSPDVPWITRRQAGLTLGRIGEPAREGVPALVELLDERTAPPGADPPRLWALKSLALFGPVAREATPAIREIALAPETTLLSRLSAIEALARIGPSDRRTLTALIHVLTRRTIPEEESEAQTRQIQVAVVEALSLYGGAAGAVIPQLTVMSRHEHEPLRRAAVATLGATANPFAIGPLEERLLSDSSPAVRDAAAIGLSQIGQAALSRIMRLLDSQDAEVRFRSADALGRMGTRAAMAVAALRRLASDPSPRVRLAAAKAIASITGDANEAVEMVLDLTGSEDRTIRIAASQFLVDSARTTPAVREDLLRWLNETEPQSRAEEQSRAWILRQFE